MASRVTDRFHVQKLAVEALQEMRIKYRWEALDKENVAIEKCRRKGQAFQAELLKNGDSVKQLLARSRYVLTSGPPNGLKVKNNVRISCLSVILT